MKILMKIWRKLKILMKIDSNIRIDEENIL